MAHNLVDDIGVPASHSFRLLGESGDRFSAPFFERLTITVARDKLEILRNLGGKVCSARAENVTENGLPRRPCKIK